MILPVSYTATWIQPEHDVYTDVGYDNHMIQTYTHTERMQTYLMVVLAGQRASTAAPWLVTDATP